MGDGTSIEWTDASWNPVTGCTKVSPGCTHCYAERMATRLRGRAAYPADQPFRVTLHPDRLEQPLRWRKPRRVFVCSMADLFHEAVPDEYIARVWAALRSAPQHQFQVLTKRPERLAKWLASIGEWGGWMTLGGGAPAAYGGHSLVVGDSDHWPLPNVWLGTSVEAQRYADERIPHLLRCPAPVRFLSCEPLLGPVSLTRVIPPPGATYRCSYCRTFTTMGRGAAGIARCPGCGERYGWCGSFPGDDGRSPIHWVIAGGESGPGARPCDPDWIRSLRDQCADTGVPFFFKQWGAWRQAVSTDDPRSVTYMMPGEERLGATTPGGYVRVGKHAAGALLDGREWREMPPRALPLPGGQAGGAL